MMFYFILGSYSIIGFFIGAFASIIMDAEGYDTGAVDVIMIMLFWPIVFCLTIYGLIRSWCGDRKYLSSTDLSEDSEALRREAFDLRNLCFKAENDQQIANAFLRFERGLAGHIVGKGPLFSIARDKTSVWRKFRELIDK